MGSKRLPTLSTTQLEADSSTAAERHLLCEVMEFAWIENARGCRRASIYFASSEDFVLSCEYLGFDADTIRAAATRQFGNTDGVKNFRAHSVAKRKNVRTE